MAGRAEQLLLKAGFDLSAVQRGMQTIADAALAINRQFASVDQKAGAAVGEQTDRVNQLKSAMQEAINGIKIRQAADAAAQKQSLRDSLDAVKKQTAEKLAAERVTRETAKTATAQQQQEDKAAHDKRMLQLKEETTEIRKQRIEGAREKQEHEENFLGQLGKAVAGRGLAGGVAAGVLTGNAAVAGFQAAKEGIVQVVEKIKEATIEAGQLVKVQQLFEGIAQAAGFDAAEAIKKLQEATEGEVSKVTLLRTATTVLNSSAGVTSDQLIQLIGDVKNLAEISGGNAAQAIDVLNRAFARGGQGLRVLAREIPLVGEALRTIDSGALDKATKSADTLKEAIRRIHLEAMAVGKVPETFEDMVNALEARVKDLYTSFGKGFTESPGAKIFLEAMAGTVKALINAESAAEKFGNVAGNVMAVVTAATQILSATVEGLARVFNAVADSIGGIFPKLNELLTARNVVKGLGDAFLAVAVSVDFVSRAISAMVKTVGALVQPFVTLISAVGAATQGAFAGVKGDLATAKRDFSDAKTMMDSLRHDDLAGRVSKIGQDEFAGFGTETANRFKDFHKSVDEGFNAKKTVRSVKRQNFPGDNGQTAAKLAELRLKNMQELDKLILQEREAEIQREKQLDDDAYHAGEEAVKAHFDRQRALAKQDRDVRIQEASSDRDAALQELEAKHRAEPEKYTSAMLSIESDTKRKEFQVKSLGIEREYQKQLTEIDRDEARDRLSVLEEETNKRLELQKQGFEKDLKSRESSAKHQQDLETQRIKDAGKSTEKQFATGRISPEEYISTREDLIQRQASAEITAAAATAAAQISTANKERDAEIAAANAVFQAKQANHQGEKAAQEQQEAITKARQTAEEKVAAAIQNSRQAAEKSTQSQKDQIEALENARSEIALGSLQRSFEPKIGAARGALSLAQMGPAGSGLAQIQEQNQNLLRLYQNQYDALSKLQAKTEENSDTWLKINASLMETRQNIEEVAQNLDKTQKDWMTPAAQTLQGIGSQIPSIFHSAFAQDLSSQLGIGSEGLSKSYDRNKILSAAFPQGTFDNFGTAFGEITKRVTTAAGAAGDFANALVNAKTAVSGGIGGTVSGAGFGQSMSGLLGKVAPALGPFGALIGAAGGGIVGAITGGKQATLEKNLNKLETSYKSIMTQFAQNTNNLSQAISQMTGLIAQAQQMQASSKKGGDKYAKIIEQYNDQLNQLKNQQAQIIHQMQETLAGLNAPIGTGDFISQLQQIVDQYEQFAGAASNANELAQANQYLTQSLAGFVNTLQNDFTDNEQTAIQNALALNDALYERSKLVYQMTQEQLQYNESVESILGQGVLTRQRTLSETKGQQIEALTIQHNQQMQDQQRQLETMDMNIKVSQFRVTAEQQIFNLSTDRVALETQLISVQQQMAQTQLQNVAALTNFLNQVKSGKLGDMASVQALLGAIPTVTNPAAGLSNSASQLQALFSSAFQSFASRGYAGYSGANIG